MAYVMSSTSIQYVHTTYAAKSSAKVHVSWHGYQAYLVKKKS